MGIDFKRPRHIRGFRLGEVLIFGPGIGRVLVEKTVSGAIAHIEDGADGVPVKNWLVTLPASLDGYSEVNGVQTGKNLIDLSSLVDGYVNSNGTFNTNHNNGEMRSGFIPVKSDTTYYFSIVETTGTADAWVGIGEYTNNDGTGFISRKSFWRFTTSSTAKYVVVSSRNLAQATKIQLEIGNDPTTWETYTPIEQYTASLGRTVYGADVDLVSGQGSETYDNTSLDDLNYNYLSNITRFNVAISGADSSGYKDNIVIPTGYTISHTLITNASNAPDMTMCMYNGSLYVKNLSCTSKVELQSALSGKTLTFPLATPTDFTFTPITPTPETALGVNNFWADEGDSQVTYYAYAD